MTAPHVSEHTQRLAEYIAAGTDAALPGSVVEKACAHILDTVAAMVSGSRLPPGERGAGFAGMQRGSGRSTVIGTKLNTSAFDAALANGMSAHADETDDSHPGSLSHPGCAIVPAAIAVAEEQSRSGLDLVRAVVVGYDVGTRVVLALGRPPVLTAQSGYSTHAYVGQFGSAAAASVLYRLGERSARHALSYAAQSAGGVNTWLRDGNHVEKAYVFGGMPATNGVRAAALVSSGCDGVEDVFVGHPNFLDAISPRANVEHLCDGLGDRYEVQRTNIKKFAVGSPAQAAVQAALEIVERHDPAVDDIEKVEIVLPGDLAHVVDSREMPDINVQYLVSGTLQDREFSFAMAHDVERMRAERSAELIAKCSLVADNAVAGVRAATVTVTLAGGAVLRSHVGAVRGTVDDPMTAAELTEKARDLMEPVLGAAGCRRVLEAVQHLPELGDAHELGSLLVTA